MVPTPKTPPLMSIETLTIQILDKMPRIHKWQHSFMVHLFTLLLRLRGRHNFENLSRYGIYNEATYRSWYGATFDFCTFNRLLIKSLEEEPRVIAFDPCFLPKSGQHTDGVGYFWSGCAGRAEHGLEIAGFASIGLRTRTAMHLHAQQTIDYTTQGTLLEYYAHLLNKLSTQLQEISSVVVADSYFAREPFVTSLLKDGFNLVSKLASNAVLLYPHKGPKTGKRGRPKKYDGRVDWLHPRETHFTPVIIQEGVKAFEGLVYVKAFKRIVKCIIVHNKRKNGTIKAEVFFSTDTHMKGEKVLEIYRLRFQIEFLYRDAKQHTGLSQCQARTKEKIHTHINASLTAVSLAKVIHHLPNKEAKPFSLASIKNQYFNEHLLNQFFIAFGIKPENHKKSTQYQKLYKYGCIAA